MTDEENLRAEVNTAEVMINELEKNLIEARRLVDSQHVEITNLKISNKFHLENIGRQRKTENIMREQIVKDNQEGMDLNKLQADKIEELSARCATYNFIVKDQSDMIAKLKEEIRRLKVKYEPKVLTRTQLKINEIFDYYKGGADLRNEVLDIVEELDR